MNRMFRNRSVQAILLALALAPARLFAEGRGGEAMVIVADSRRFTGWRAWWTNLYNDSHLLFALATVVIVPVVGLLLGKLTSMAMARIGINLKTREVREH
jgi:hypothetical protein